MSTTATTTTSAPSRGDFEDGEIKERVDDTKSIDDRIKDQHVLDNLEGDTKDIVRTIFETIIDINGAQSDIVAGQPKTYIEVKAYYQYIEAKEAEGKALSEAQIDIIERVLNYLALGGGKMGLLGSAIRHELRDFYSTRREATKNIITGTKLSKEVVEGVSRFKDDLKRYSHLYAVVSKNAKSFIAQAGINMFTKLHHWDAKNQREWTALFSALGVRDEFEGEDLRALVYLAGHPIDLATLNKFRKAAAGDTQQIDIVSPIKRHGEGTIQVELEAKGFVNSVSIRARAIPAGCATFAVCGAALHTLMSETYASRLIVHINEKSDAKLDDFRAVLKDLHENGESYHIMSREFEVQTKKIDMDKFKMWLDVACAYVFEVVKGTLAKSAALNKYQDMNTRTVGLWRTRFKLEKSSEKDALSAYLSASERKEKTPAAKIAEIASDLAVLRVTNEYVDENIRSRSKASERLVEVEKSGINVDRFLPPSTH
jgi:hypothetical protein